MEGKNLSKDQALGHSQGIEGRRMRRKQQKTGEEQPARQEQNQERTPRSHGKKRFKKGVVS